MSLFISLLRGINVSGQKKVKMDDLKKLYEGLGFKNVKTYIQSGNVIFNSQVTNISTVTKRIEQKIKEQFGFDVTVIIRTPEELRAIIKANPFTKEDEGRVYITFLADKPKNVPAEDIEKVKDTSELFLIKNKEVYLFCPNGYGKTKLSNAFFERKLNITATTRNWNTVTNLLGLSTGHSL